MAPSSLTQPDVVLFRGFPISNAYVWSPFVTKLEARLRFAGLPYRVGHGSMKKAPRGKIPYVEMSFDDQKNTTVLSDSGLIIQALTDEGFCEDFNATLSPVVRAYDVAIRALLEEKLYFYQMFEKWHDNYETMRSGLFSVVCWPIQLLLGLFAYRSVTRTLYGQGAGRFSGDELATFRRDIWENVNALLSEARLATLDAQAPFWVLGGRVPSEADATVFGFIASGLVCTAVPDTQAVLRSYPVLVDYAKRIHNAYFSEYVMWDE